MKYYASVSFGKDSLAMLFMLIDKGYQLDEVVFYDTGMEFQAIYNTRDAVLPILKKLGIKYTWCGGTCRWGTSEKLRALKAHTKDGIDYVGIAADEMHRFEKEKRPNRVLPLRDWGITEADALQYCYTKGFVWHEDGVRLYELLDRVSCWCCGNKNLKELKNMYLYLPWYWKKLKELQLNTDRPYRRNSGETIFDLEERFKREMQ